MLLKKGILILCLLCFGIAHSQKKIEDLKVTKIGISLKLAQGSLQSLMSSYSNIGKNGGSPYSVNTNSKSALRSCSQMKNNLNSALTTINESVSEYKRLKNVSVLPNSISYKLSSMKNYINKTISAITSMESTLRKIQSNSSNTFALKNYYKTGMSHGDKIVSNLKSSFSSAKSYFLAYGNELGIK